MRPRQAAQVRAPRHQDRVHVVGLVDVADRHGGDAGLVADAIGERRLEHAAVDRPRLPRGLARRHVDDVDPGVAQQARDGDGVLRRDALARPPSRWRRCAPRSASPPATPRAPRDNTSSGKRMRFSSDAAVGVGAAVGQRRDERRHAGSRARNAARAGRSRRARPSAAARTNSSRTVSMSARVISRGTWLSRRPRHRRRPHHLPVAARQRRIHRLPAELGRALSAPSVPSCMAILASVSAWTKSTMRFHAASCAGRVEAGAAGRDAALGRHAGHLGEDQPGAALGPLGVVHEVPVGRRAVDGAILRHRRDDDPVLQVQIAQAERREHRRARAVRLLAASPAPRTTSRRSRATPCRASAGSRG